MCRKNIDTRIIKFNEDIRESTVLLVVLLKERCSTSRDSSSQLRFEKQAGGNRRAVFSMTVISKALINKMKRKVHCSLNRREPSLSNKSVLQLRFGCLRKDFSERIEHFDDLFENFSFARQFIGDTILERSPTLHLLITQKRNLALCQSKNRLKSY